MFYCDVSCVFYMEKELGKEKKKQAKPLNVQKSLLLKKTSLKNAEKKPKFGLFSDAIYFLPFSWYFCPVLPSYMVVYFFCSNAPI